MKLQIVAQSFRTLHPDQNCLLQLCAEAHCQPVCPCARPVIGWPGVRDEGSSSPEDVSCPSCKTQRKFSCSITVGTQLPIRIWKLHTARLFSTFISKQSAVSHLKMRVHTHTHTRTHLDWFSLFLVRSIFPLYLPPGGTKPHVQLFLFSPNCIILALGNYRGSARRATRGCLLEVGRKKMRITGVFLYFF